MSRYMNSMVKHLLFSRDWQEAFDSLTDEQAGVLVKGIYAYANQGFQIETDDPAVLMAFRFMAMAIENDMKSYALRCAANRKNGKRGGRPKKEPEESNAPVIEAEEGWEDSVS